MICSNVPKHRGKNILAARACFSVCIKLQSWSYDRTFTRYFFSHQTFPISKQKASNYHSNENYFYSGILSVHIFTITIE